MELILDLLMGCLLVIVVLLVVAFGIVHLIAGAMIIGNMILEFFPSSKQKKLNQKVSKLDDAAVTAIVDEIMRPPSP
jgi:hypothetical protein